MRDGQKRHYLKINADYTIFCIYKNSKLKEYYLI